MKFAFKLMTRMKLHKYKNLFLLGALFCLFGKSMGQSWHELSEMPIPVTQASAIVLNDTVYIIGGLQGKDQTPSTLIQTFYPPTETWGVLTDMHYARVFPLVASFAGKLVILGGAENPDGQTTLEMVDPRNPTPAIHAQDRNFYRLGASAAMLNGWLYLFGGYQGNPLQASSLHFISGLALNTLQVSTIDSTFFSGFLPFEHSSVALNGKVYMFGGVINTISNKVLRLDPDSGTLDQISSLLTARASGAAVSDDDQTIYILGGYNQQQAALNSMEQYRILGNSVSSWGLSPMHHARRAPCAVYYEDTIFVFGGVDEYGRMVQTVEAYIQQATSVKQESASPRTCKLYQNYPNPFNMSTTLSFSLPHASKVKLEIFAANGQWVRTLVDHTLDRGEHHIEWYGLDYQEKPVPSGVYLYKLSTLEWTKTLKCVLIK
ncbi:T9SS type A sorting domain-containing protein [candidate division KSB1 bacterium]|nr:T9SS type A sorting domain-containing protein [candidate division KSB1 bacterium]